MTVTSKKLYIAGGKTLLGSALRRVAPARGGYDVLDAPDPDFTDARAVDDFFERQRPDTVIVTAGRAGGIQANIAHPATFMAHNLAVVLNVISEAQRHGVKRLLYIASSCAYPRDAAQPMAESALCTGPVEPTNEAYATAKLAGIRYTQAVRQEYGLPYIAAIPSNMFGPGDHFDENAHVMAALMRRIHDAKVAGAPSVTIWGTGNPQREFVFVDDIADACLHLLDRYDEPNPINLGGGVALSIRELAETIRDVTGYEGALEYDTSKPDGMPVKVLDSARLFALGWKPKTAFREGVEVTYRWFLDHVAKASERSVAS